MIELMVRDVLFTLLSILDPDNRQSWKNVLKVVSLQHETVSANIFQEKILFSFIFVFADISLEKPFATFTRNRYIFHLSLEIS